MWKIICNGVSRHSIIINNMSLKTCLLKRNFLSSAYELEPEFNARLSNKIIKQINPSSMYLELDQQYNRHRKLHAIDIDLYVNSISSDIHTEELEDILYKFRLTPTTIDMLDSTSHAFIRLYLKLNKIQDLLQILDDRLNYGIFPDEYCNNLLMNYFIKTNNYRDAAKTATIQMLQEDFSNEITKYLSLYSCLKYLEAPIPWNLEPISTEKSQEDDDDEEVRVRVDFLRNPYFDGHFDLKSPNDLIGKTFTSIGRSNQADVLNQSYTLIGLGLTKNIDEAKKILSQVESGNIKVSSHSLELFKKFITTEDISVPVSSETSTQPASAEGDNTTSPAPSDSQANMSDDLKAVLSLVDGVENVAVNVNMLENTENKLKEVIQKFEAQEIEKQKQKYLQWDGEREQILKKHVEKLKEEEIFNTIEQKKMELAADEERIFYFDNETQIDLQLEEKYPPKEEVVVKKRNEFDGMRNLGLRMVNNKKKQVVDESYVPPDLHKPYQK